MEAQLPRGLDQWRARCILAFVSKDGLGCHPENRLAIKAGKRETRPCGGGQRQGVPGRRAPEDQQLCPTITSSWRDRVTQTREQGRTSDAGGSDEKLRGPGPSQICSCSAFADGGGRGLAVAGEQGWGRDPRAAGRQAGAGEGLRGQGSVGPWQPQQQQGRGGLGPRDHKATLRCGPGVRGLGTSSISFNLRGPLAIGEGGEGAAGAEPWALAADTSGGGAGDVYGVKGCHGLWARTVGGQWDPFGGAGDGEVA